MNKSPLLLFEKSRIFWVAAILVVLIAVLLRFYHIDQRSLWYDELATANYSRGTLKETLERTRSYSSAPIVHPFILNLVEKYRDDALAVRLPSFLAGVLAIVVLLSARWAGVGARATVISALLLALSATQIRYSQEVREYSLSVLTAALLLLAYLRYASAEKKGRSLIVLGVLLIVAPFVQYGLVLFGGAIVGAMLVVRLTQGTNPSKTVMEAGVAALCLGAGGVGSLLSTLQDQLYLVGMHQDIGFYFDPAIHHNVLVFLAYRTYGLLAFMLQGPSLLVLIVPTLIFYIWGTFRSRRWDPILIIGLMSVTTAVLFALLRLYPYGGFRQSLYLAPVLVLVTATSLDHFVGKFSPSRQSVAIAAIVMTIVIAAAVDFRNKSPYAEYEDIKSVFAKLTKSAQTDDQIYVYYQAQPAFEFYKYQPRRLIYGDDHRADPSKFVTALQGMVEPNTVRLWLVFSHVVNNEDSVILRGLERRWSIEKVVDANGAALFLAQRKSDGPRPAQARQSITPGVGQGEMPNVNSDRKGADFN
jgi:hypothetical protein